MRIFHITNSEKFTGEIVLKYDECELLYFLELPETLSSEQKRWFLSNLPRSLAGLDKFKLMFASIIITEVKQNVTFAMFWQRWFANRNVDNSDKKRAEAKWNKLPESDRIKAYQFIYTYMSRIPAGTAPKHAETYLNSGVWT